LDYELVTYSRDPETMRSPPELGEVHPSKKSPIIEDDGRIVLESGAIVEYLTQVKAGGRLAHGPDSPDYVDYLQWLHFTEGSLMSPLVYNLIAAAMGCDNEGLQAFTDGEIATLLDHADTHLRAHEYLVGNEFSAADVHISFPLEFAQAQGILKAYPALQTYLQRLQDRPAYQRARDKGGNYDLSMFNVEAMKGAMGG
ncbi:MAG: glutathione binding-like protein, partial [Salinisphaera sp.]|nr:glutathione binding-like protein [Salinisphaera sp.]